MDDVVHVREPRPADAEAMARVHVRAWQAGYAGRLPDAYLSGLGARLGDRIDSWRSRLERSPDGVLVATLGDTGSAGGAEDTGDTGDTGSTGTEPAHRADTGASANLVVPPRDLLGICGFGEPRDTAPMTTGELQMLNVDPTAWGTGLADALFEAAVGRLAERYAAAYLWVLDRNERAQRFYRRHGWAPDGASRVEEVGDVRVSEVRYVIRFDR